MANALDMQNMLKKGRQAEHWLDAVMKKKEQEVEAPKDWPKPAEEKPRKASKGRETLTDKVARLEEQNKLLWTEIKKLRKGIANMKQLEEGPAAADSRCEVCGIGIEPRFAARTGKCKECHMGGSK